MTQREMFDALQAHARKHYNEGWDWVVEGLDFRDFQGDLLDAGLDTWDKVILHYTEKSEIRAERYEDIRSEAW